MSWGVFFLNIFFFTETPSDMLWNYTLTSDNISHAEEFSNSCWKNEHKSTACLLLHYYWFWPSCHRGITWFEELKSVWEWGWGRSSVEGRCLAGAKPWQQQWQGKQTGVGGRSAWWVDGGPDCLCGWGDQCSANSCESLKWHVSLSADVFKKFLFSL